MATINDFSFAVFILTHGRPDRVVTYTTLRRQGYTGRIYIIIDNEDAKADQYRRAFGDQVIEFDKLAISKTFDTADNFRDRRAVVFARNASFRIAKDLGLGYFLQLDDDYTSFVHKFDSHLRYRERPAQNLDRLFAIMLQYYSSINALTIALAQNGDFIGGKDSQHASGNEITSRRKAMNTFFCSTARPFQFIGRVNEDVNTYVNTGNRGGLFLTIFSTAIIQRTTQSSQGGMTELYQAEGTYRKSFYTLMFNPSCSKIAEMGHTRRRLHHRITWRNAVPCIVSEAHRHASMGQAAR